MPKFKTYKVYCNTIYILESLEGETKTGLWLYDDLRPITIKDDSFKIKYLPFDSLELFFKELEQIEIDSKFSKILPIIHIEAHGNEDGFVVAQTKQLISWRELNLALSKINYNTRNNLVLSLGVCKGYSINLDMSKFFYEGKHCPYMVNISPNSNISSGEITDSFSALYHSLLDKRDFFSAMKKMKEATSLNFISTANYFASIIISKIKKYPDSHGYSKRSESDLKYLYQKRKELLPNESFEKNLAAFEDYKIEFRQKLLKKLWNTFLMIEEFEENKERFDEFEKQWES